MRLILFIAIILTLFQVFSPPVASAQVRHPPGESGPYETVLEEIQGPYRIRVWQSPRRAIVGTVRFIIEIRDIENNAIDDAMVEVFGQPEEGRKQKSIGLNTPLRPFFYHASIETDDPGAWLFTFNLSGPDGAVAVLLEEDISSRTRSGVFVQPATWLFISLQATLLLSAIYIWRNGRKRKRSADRV